jgi:hypothetical protein
MACQLASILRFCNISPPPHPAHTLAEQITTTKTLKFSTLPKAFHACLKLASPSTFNHGEAPRKLTQTLEQQESVLRVVRQLDHLRERALDPLALASTLPSHQVTPSKNSSLDWLNLETRRSHDLQLTPSKMTSEQSRLVNPQSTLELQSAQHPTRVKVSYLIRALDWLITPLTMLKQSLTPADRQATVALPKSTQLLMKGAYDGAVLRKNHVLGKGVYGSVRMVSYADSVYALKEPNLTAKDASKYWVREGCVYMALNHASIVTLKGVSSNGLLLEKIQGGSLSERLAKNTPFAPTQLHNYLTDIAAALVSIHNSGRTYKDLKPNNVLLDGDRAKLCDFGLTVRTSGDQEYSGSPLFQAPEIHRLMDDQAKSPTPIQSSITQAADSWSFGVLLYTIITGGYYLSYHNPQEKGKEYVQRISRTYYGLPCNKQELFAPLTPQHQALLRDYDTNGILRSIVVDCLHGDPAKRISMHEVQKRLAHYTPSPSHK